MNDLIPDSPTTSITAGVRVLDFGKSAVDAAVAGDWLGASLSGLGAAAEGVAMIIDPIGELLASGAAFLMEHVHPLPEMLDSIAGDPAQIQVFAGTWYNVAARLNDVADGYTTAQRGTAQDWTGDTATQYQCFADNFAEMMRSVASICDGTGRALAIASGVVAAVRAIVRDLIADLVAKLIKWVAEIALTVGIGASWVVPQACAAVTKWVSRVSVWLSDLTTAMAKLSDLTTTIGTSVKATNKAQSEVVSVMLAKPRLDLPSWPTGSMPKPPWHDPMFGPDMIPHPISTPGHGANAHNQSEQSQGNR
ncbi:hypothetical protein [Sanguibacter sp. 25GB23B1]|uniref:WXG100 family type VII secretion target n=1 Tax=unclassified Sanguibacter TaxID=2645534 RepID=UPI0032AFA88E